MADKNSQLDPDQQDAVDPEEAAREKAQQAAAPAAPAASPINYDSVMGLGEAQGMLEDRNQAVGNIAKQSAGDIRDVAEEKKGAVDANAGIDAQIAKTQLPIMGLQQIAANQHAEATARVAGLRQKALDQLNHLDEIAAGLANEKLENPFARMSTGQKAFAYLSQMFGAFTSGVMGGPNIPAQLIHDELKQDLEIQKYNMLHGQQGLQNQQGILSSMLKVFGDMDTAQSAAYVATTDAFKRRMDMIAAAYKQPKIVAAAQAAKAAIDEKATADVVKVKEHFSQQRNDLTKAEADLSKAGAALEMANKRLAQQKANQKTGVLVDEYILPPNTPTAEAGKLQEDYASMHALKDQVSRYAAVMDEVSMLTDPVQKVARLRSASAGLVDVLRQRFGTGANFSVNEEGNIMAQLPGIGSMELAPETAMSVLADLVQREEQKTQRKLQVAGARKRNADE